jgi:hypothetical protein
VTIPSLKSPLPGETPRPPARFVRTPLSLLLASTFLNCNKRTQRMFEQTKPERMGLTKAGAKLFPQGSWRYPPRKEGSNERTSEATHGGVWPPRKERHTKAGVQTPHKLPRMVSLCMSPSVILLLLPWHGSLVTIQLYLQVNQRSFILFKQVQSIKQSELPNFGHQCHERMTILMSTTI